jgi:hypothetical protein
MSDIKLLAMAARAAGITLEWHEPTPPDDGVPCFNDHAAWCFIPSAVPPHNRRASDKEQGVIWNPLTDDGDALRLAVTLRIDIQSFSDDGVRAVVDRLGKALGVPCGPSDDRYAATRRAIVRAAAALAERGAAA